MSHRRIEAPQFAHLQVAQAQSDRFYKSLYSQDALPEAVMLTKAEFAEQFLTGKHDTFSLDKLAQFRELLTKANPETGEEEFKKSCDGLRPFVIVGKDEKGNDRQWIKYVRAKALKVVKE